MANKIKLLTFYSPSHEELYNKFFLESFFIHLSQNFQLIPKRIEQFSKTGNYGEDGFEESMIFKIEHILENIEVGSMDLMVFSDADVKFMGNIRPHIEGDIGHLDIAFQDDVTCLCAGFFICRQNQKVLDFFRMVYELMNSNMKDGKMKNGLSDQIIINHLYRNLQSDIKIGKLDGSKYFTVAQSNGPNQWNGEDFSIPDNILVHHANWTVGIENKKKLLLLSSNKHEAIRNLV